MLDSSRGFLNPAVFIRVLAASTVGPVARGPVGATAGRDQERSGFTWVSSPLLPLTLEKAVAAVTLPPGPGLAWVAGEASMARTIVSTCLR
jgi:hypothetical protein